MPSNFFPFNNYFSTYSKYSTNNVTMSLSSNLPGKANLTNNSHIFLPHSINLFRPLAFAMSKEMSVIGHWTLMRHSTLSPLFLQDVCLSACVCVCTCRYPWRREEGIRFPGAKDGCKPTWVLGTKLSSSEKAISMGIHDHWASLQHILFLSLQLCYPFNTILF